MSSSFPTEIWRLVWRHVAPADLKALSSSCRLFRDICQPFLFQNLAFIGPLPADLSPGRNCKATIRRLKRTRDRILSIASSPHIPAMVHRWVFNGIPTVENLLDNSTSPIIYHPGLKKIVELSLAINSLFSSTFGVYTNLSILEISGFPFSPEFCETLASLPKLNTMHVAGCDIICPPACGGVALDTFTFSHPLVEWDDGIVERYNLVSTSKLALLSIAQPVPSKAFLSVFTASGPLPRLVRLILRLSYDAKDLFYRFLDCCPELRDLDIDAPPIFAGVPLPETSIPMLCAFRGPVEIAGTFTAGRPVRAVKLETFPDNDEPVEKTLIEKAILQMSRSTATMEEIDLPFISLDSSVLRLVSELFPQLKRIMFFLRNTGAVQTDGGHSDEESEGDWETVDGSVDGEDDSDEVIEAQQDDEMLGEDLAQHLLQSLLSMTAQDMAYMHAVMPKGEDAPPRDDDEKSEYSDRSEEIEWPEDETTASRMYEDIKLDSFEHFLLSLANDSVPLPRNVRYLGIGQIPRARNEKSMSDADVSFVVEKLGNRYPGLSKVLIGKRPRAWTKKRGQWIPPKPEVPSVFQRLCMCRHGA
ncbi:hypothetical protein B0H11DRAFT_597863 [Mycena galericulata]|nr:hypothetical protein B0H11DRAFT_597863 [Mycena galericulata]